MGILVLIPSLCLAASDVSLPSTTQSEDDDTFQAISAANRILSVLAGDSHDMSHLTHFRSSTFSLWFRVRTSETGYVIVVDEWGYSYELPSGEMYELTPLGTRVPIGEIEKWQLLLLLQQHSVRGCNKGCGPTNSVGGEPAPTPTPVQNQED